MARSGADLLALQGNIKRDPEGYADEFQLQYRHYQACLTVFQLKPSKDSREFGDLVNFVAQVANCYPRETAAFCPELIELLDKHYAVLDSALRQSLVKALILLRNRGQIQPTELLPVFFRLFRCQDKALRQTLFRHIVADIKGSNQKHKDDRLNRSIQNFLYSMLQDDSEIAAKKSLAVLTELYRRHVWRDARTVNVIASAVFHPSTRLMLPAIKFFLGQDEKDDAGESDDDEDEAPPAAPSKAEVYKATKKGTVASKKKKAAKLKRVMATVKKHQRREKADHADSFAAVQLLHDPQSFAEKLFARLHKCGGERFETRLAMMTLISRIIGMHKLLLLNFYPFLQKYIQPHQRDVTHILASMVQACHDLVPPDTLAPVLRQLVDQFINDRAQPEVMTVGIKTVREICMRSPLVMNEDLLQDLAAYKKYRDKAVSSAARGLIGLFREIAPGMLEKRDRGRGADLSAAPMQYGASVIKDRIEGAELLEEALRRGDAESGDEEGSGNESDSDEDGEGSDGSDAEAEAGGVDVSQEAEAGEAAAGSGEDEDEDMEEDEEAGSDAAAASGSGSEAALDELGSDEGEGESEQEADEDAAMDGEDEAAAAALDEEALVERRQSGSAGPRNAAGAATQLRAKQAKQAPNANSLGQLKKQLAEASAAKKRKAEGPPDADGGGNAAPEDGTPLEWGRILTEEDFERIRELRHKRLVDAAMKKHGLKSASKRERLLAAAEEEADAAMAFQDRRNIVAEERVDPSNLQGKHKRRQDKEARMASVLEGREGREGFGAASGRKKQKSGGMSNKEKAKKKDLPIVARIAQIRRRAGRQKGGSKNFKGHVKSSHYTRR
ncbi:hypothetical protein WJX72_007420 [[Myrmecia] bisecta]|uniref:Protein SDA1 n=1 Tax=[Myrmecia] bisecta TaxID=41462 RepID=A0AAW1PT60_9CHLO